MYGAWSLIWICAVEKLRIGPRYSQAPRTYAGDRALTGLVDRTRSHANAAQRRVTARQKALNAFSWAANCSDSQRRYPGAFYWTFGVASIQFWTMGSVTSR